ncbi:MAG: peroxiredoxin [Betaproteobacteria bacterium]|jgi:peroxiredoxin Q/BCP|nr:peroxiredoxin [Rhodocyclaceae bacterium]MCA3133068.1 peroxiredoxin [Rhodocyclaceae bacterium]MCA3141853.1 peroxiredoxin [Rhodocyclaceae bacterium]MCA3144761.1 peroxiredoxin [Rhodocyclaceae bacterium]MCE2896659.1 peroxiredoxin [Betaproteobacteria bacterium]
MLKIGDAAPDFELPDAEMESVSLASFRGRHHVVLYFYQRDDTPSCTLEAIDFSERDDNFRRHGAVVLGVSMDDCLAHGSFRDKHGLSVSLLSDVEGEVCESYGVLQHKTVDGQSRRCIQRSTFIIDKNGCLAHVLYGVNVKGHAAEVLNLVKEL